MHCLPRCSQINVTHSGMNQMMAIVCYMVLYGGWCDWPVTQNSRYWHHKIFSISCLNSQFLSQFMLKKSLQAHLPFCISLLLVSCNYFKLCKSAFTTWHRTTILKCRDWEWSADLSRKVNESTIDLLAGCSPNDYRLDMGPKLDVQYCKVLGCVWTVSGVSLQKVLTVTVVFTLLL